jgi:hypothetical protein
MIGKVVYTSMDLSSSLWRCYIFCVRCAQVHEIQDGPASMCCLSPVPIPVQTGSFYHMVSSYGKDEVLAAVNKKDAKKKKGCCICSSHSAACKIPVMMRKVVSGIVTYSLQIRTFCMKHAPPPNLVQSGVFIDDNQLMKFCYERSIAASSSSSFSSVLKRRKRR